MYCKTCGTANDDNALKCIHCGQPMQQAGAPSVSPMMIPNYLVQSILVTLFCCIPLGIPAIVYAAQVNGHVGQGNTQAALDASAKAKMWCWIAFGVGLVVIGLFMILEIIGIWAAVSQQPHM